MDYKPRSFSAEACMLLCNYADMVVSDLERSLTLTPQPVPTALLQYRDVIKVCDEGGVIMPHKLTHRRFNRWVPPSCEAASGKTLRCWTRPSLAGGWCTQPMAGQST